jgi:hypothetical protein
MSEADMKVRATGHNMGVETGRQATLASSFKNSGGGPALVKGAVGPKPQESG